MRCNGSKISFHVRFGAWARYMFKNEFFTACKSSCTFHGICQLLSDHLSVGLSQKIVWGGGFIENDRYCFCLPKLMPFLFPEKQLASTFCLVILIY